MSTVSELTALKIENSMLRIQQLQAMGTQLMTDQKALVEIARTEAEAGPTDIYDVEKRVFVPAPSAS